MRERETETDRERKHCNWNSCRDWFPSRCDLRLQCVQGRLGWPDGKRSRLDTRLGRRKEVTVVFQQVGKGVLRDVWCRRAGATGGRQ